MVRRVLIVDDNEMSRLLPAAFFERLGWQTLTAADGKVALDLLRKESFDLVLLDLRMPDLGGDDVCRRIRTELGLTDLTVIAYTAHGMADENSRAVADGFSGLLVKPITFQDVRRLSDTTHARLDHDDRTAQ